MVGVSSRPLPANSRSRLSDSRHGLMWLAVLFAALFLGSALLLVYYLRRAVVCGELPQRFPFGTILRNKSPIAFWFGIGAHGVFAGFLLFLGLGLLGLAPHWFIALLRNMHH